MYKLVLAGLVLGSIFSSSAAAFTLASSAFKNGDTIPTEYTCEGLDKIPDLQWINPPAGTKSFALITDDPDAPNGTWTHWVMFNIPENSNGWSKGNETVSGVVQATNSWGKTGYGGPCPPIGTGTHRYFFRLYALDTVLDLPASVDANQLRAAIKEHILAETVLIGKYKYSKSM